MEVRNVESVREFDGWIRVYQHPSATCNCTMQFSLYLPPQAESEAVSSVWFLSGLTCTDENFRIKAGAQRYANELGLALVIPDTSPRGDEVADDDAYDLGQGAGFYVNATRPPWASHFRTYDYIVKELPQLLSSLQLPLNGRQSITGFSMGGHGALTIGLRHPDIFASVSAFAPICNPVNSPWGQKAFRHYLGDDESCWRRYDACCLIEDGAARSQLLVDQGTADEFYPQQMRTEALQQACHEKGIDLRLRYRQGYDHSFHFVATFIGEHLAWHKRFLDQ